MSNASETPQAVGRAKGAAQAGRRAARVPHAARKSESRSSRVRVTSESRPSNFRVTSESQPLREHGSKRSQHLSESKLRPRPAPRPAGVVQAPRRRRRSRRRRVRTRTRGADTHTSRSKNTTFQAQPRTRTAGRGPLRAPASRAGAPVPARQGRLYSDGSRRDRLGKGKGRQVLGRLRASPSRVFGSAKPQLDPKATPGQGEGEGSWGERVAGVGCSRKRDGRGARSLFACGARCLRGRRHCASSSREANRRRAGAGGPGPR